MNNSYYNQNDNQYERNMKYVKKDTTYSKSYRTAPVDDIDYDQPMPPLKNKYQQPIDERSPISSYSRNTSSYYTSSSKHLSHQSPNQISSSSSTFRSSSTRTTIHNSQQQAHSDETEYERKRRLAFESAPWNESADLSPSMQHSTRSSPLDRHSQSSGSKLYSSNKYSSKQIDNTAESYYDPWRRSKSPYNNSSSRQNPGQIYHHSRSKSKSDSGSTAEFSDPEMVEQQYSHKKRLDPEYANKHRPSSFRDNNNGSGENSSYIHHHHSSSSYDRLDHPSSSTSQNKKSYYKEQIDELPQTPSSSYQKGGNTTPIPDEIDIPSYERPKSIPRTRKDSWSDTDSEESCSSNSSYSESGSESENSDNDEPYSR